MRMTCQIEAPAPPVSYFPGSTSQVGDRSVQVPSTPLPPLPLTLALELVFTLAPSPDFLVEKTTCETVKSGTDPKSATCSASPHSLTVSAFL
jgi:hypothetical protein